MSVPWFTVRVYGVLAHEGRVLVSDEVVLGRRVTKFPGGGLEYGEGLKEALVREVQEELGIEALDVEHLYTTDFFQRSVFHEEDVQVIAVYYMFRVADPASIPVAEAPFRFSGEAGCQQSFRWVNVATSTEEDLSLPIDRVVWHMLKEGVA